LELGEHALKEGSQALLLPMPYFFRYEQEDLEAYARHVVHTLDAPCLLYNLAAFTNPLQPETSLALLRTEPHFVGMKDSSGDRSALRSLADARQETPFSLMCGSDGLILDALDAGWDGTISGIASCCPEVLVALYRHHLAGRQEEARHCQQLLDALVDMIGRLPFPWSIRIAAEVRGIPTGPLPYPLSPHRQQQVAQLRREYEQWFDEHVPVVSS
jgi:4-hydroxy-tetrahydrodipicolinate synthase